MMALWGYRPVLPEFAIEDPKRDFKNAEVVEQYHLSGRALYMPDRGLSWRYLPLDRIRGVIPGRESRDEDSAMGSYHIEQPTIRVIYGGGVEILTLESRSQAEHLFSLLKRGREASKKRGDK